MFANLFSNRKKEKPSTSRTSYRIFKSVSGRRNIEAHWRTVILQIYSSYTQSLKF